MRTAWTRPGGTVCARVSSSPWRSRRPSGDSATVKSKCTTTDRTTAGTVPMTAGRANGSIDHSPVTTVTVTSVTAAITSDDQPHRPELALDELGERHLDQHPLGCLGRVVVQAGRPGEQLGAQLLRGRLAEVGERRLGRRPAGHLEAQLGEPECPGDERAYDVDCLQAVETHPPRPAEQDTGLETQVLAVDAIAGRAPGHVPVDDAERDAHADAEQQPRPLEVADGQLLRGDDDRRREHLPAAQHRRQRVQAVERRRSPGCRSAAQAAVSGGSDRSQARRRGLAARGEPVTQPGGLGRDQAGDPCVGGRRRRVQLHGRQAEPPVQRTGSHVDVLHAPVGHDDELPVEDAAGDEQVVGALGVAPRPHRTAHDQPAPDDADQAGDARPRSPATAPPGRTARRRRWRPARR